MAYGQLDIYNAALRECKNRSLASVTDNQKARYLLDQIWGDGGVTTGGIKSCLEDGYWTFARRRVQAMNDPTYQQQYGYQYRFTFPPDWVKTMGVYSDQYGNQPLTDYEEEGQQFIMANLNVIYFDYVSNDPAYGLNLNGWPESFKEMVELYFAMKIVSDLTKSDSLEKAVMEKYERAARDARSKTAMEQPTRFKPLGSFVRARGGSLSLYGRDRNTGD